jgi:glycosyl transferase, family 25
MQVLIINLAAAHARLNFQATQMQALGLLWSRIEAVTANDAVDTRDASYWNGWERPLRPTEKACLLSHMAAWRSIVDSGEPALVLEDDAVLSRETPALLQALRGLASAKHVTLEVRQRKKWIGLAVQPIAPGLALRRLYRDRSGAAAYVLWPAGAAALLARAARRPGLADALICEATELESLQVEPACAVQLDMCAAYGIDVPSPAASFNTGDRPAVHPREWLGFRWRRIKGQLAIAACIVPNLVRAVRREIELRSDAFDPPGEAIP